MTNNDLINKAIEVVGNYKMGDNTAGGVGCALITEKGSIYRGVCIDTNSGMGFCAEHGAIAAMITAGEFRISKVVAVWKNDKGEVFVLPPCGRCREFMYQINKNNLETAVILDKDKTVSLKELLPYHDWWQKII